MAVVRYRDPVTGKLVPFRVIKGENGHQMYVRFSAYADGTDMSEKWDAERNFMGIAFDHVAPTEKEAYQWISFADISLGRYAEEGSADKYLFFVGNGTDENNRSNALTLDDEGNLHVTGEVTFGEDKFSPREAAAKQKEYIDKHTITTDRVTDLTAFMEGYKVKREVLFDGTVTVRGDGLYNTYVQVTLSDNMSNYDILCFRIDHVNNMSNSFPSFSLLHQYESGKYLTLATVKGASRPDDYEEGVSYKQNTASYAIKTADGEYMFDGFDTVQSYTEPCKPLCFDTSSVYIPEKTQYVPNTTFEVAVKVTGYKLVP